MADPFLAEIRIFPFNFAPRGWAWCDGQIMPISQNTALFSLVGTVYGGDGRTTFSLPDLQGRAPLQQGRGPGLSERVLGETGGQPAVTLDHAAIPAHGHAVRAAPDAADLHAPGPNRSWARSQPGFAYAAGSPDAMMAPQAIDPTGGSQPHNNMQPFLTVYFAIALQGIYPPRS